MKTIFFGALLASCGFELASSLKCDRTPEGSSASKSPPDGRFKLRIANDPARYIPGDTYNSEFMNIYCRNLCHRRNLSVTLEGVSKFGQTTQQKFTGFFITVEKDQTDVRQGGDDNVGRFHITPESASMSKFSEKCQNLVTHTSSFSKTEIMVNKSLTALKAINLIR